jgi:hypothetical protein
MPISLDGTLWEVPVQLPPIELPRDFLHFGFMREHKRRFKARIRFSVSQENSIRIAAMCCFTMGGAAWRWSASTRVFFV